ncbi:MAG: glutamine synthetase family protein [Pseudomonadota bacterium]
MNTHAPIAEHSQASLASFMAENPDVEIVELLIVDPNGILRGKIAPIDTVKKALGLGVNFPVSIHGLDCWGREVPQTGLHIESGDRDGFFRAVPNSLSIIPWSEASAAQMLLEGYCAKGDPLAFDCRHVLNSAINTLAEMGVTAVAAFELEFFILDEAAKIPTTASTGPDQQLMYCLEAVGEHSALFDEIRSAAQKQGVLIDTIVSEAAPGQFEVNLKHRSNVMRAADDAVLLRRIVKACANKLGKRATFMAKPFIDHAGNGMHVHVSLCKRTGGNVFADSDEGSTKLKSCVASLLKTMPTQLPVFINSWNGFRRMQPGSYAPTTAAWGENNRSVAVRIPASDVKNRRIEHRIAGADTNPYLVLASILSAMADGLKNLCEPPPASEGNAYDQHGLESLGGDLPTALGLMEVDPFTITSLGPEMAKVFMAIKHAEAAEFGLEITPLERSTYL